MGLGITWEGAAIYLAVLCALFLIGRFFSVPFKWLMRLVGNTLLGGLALVLFNAVAGFWGMHIGVNPATAVCVGVLGVPGFLALVAIYFLI